MTSTAPTLSSASGKAKPRWTAEQVELLTALWGTTSLDHISRTLKRTQHSISRKARALDLGLTLQDRLTLRAFAKKCGYTIPKIKKAARLLNIELRHAPRSEPSRKGRVKWARHFALNVLEQDAIIKLLLEKPVLFENLKGSGKTQAGVWGVGKKPPACLRCNTTERKHKAAGYCVTCHTGYLKRKRREAKRTSSCAI